MDAKTFVKKAVRKLLKPVYLRIVDEIAVCDLSQAPAPPSDSSFVFEELREDHLPGIATEMGQEKADAFRNLMKGATAYIALEHGRIAAYAWASDKPRQHEGCDPLFYDIDPLPGYGYIFAVFVRPEWRRRGVVTTLMGHMLRALRERGLKNAFMTFDARNTAMRRLATRYGFRIVSQIRGHRICSTRFTIYQMDLSAVCKTF